MLQQPECMNDVLAKTIDVLDDVFETNCIGHIIANFIWDFSLSSFWPIQAGVTNVKRDCEIYLEMGCHIYEMNRVNMDLFMQAWKEEQDIQDEIDYAALGW